MKNVILLFCTLFSWQFSMAQVEAFNFPLTTKGHKKVIAFENTQGSVHYVFINKSSLDITWLESGKRKNVIITLEKRFKKAKVIVASANEANVQVFFFQPKLKTIAVLLLHKNTGEYTFKDILVMQPNEQLLKLVKDDDQVQVLSVFENNVLRVISVTDALVTATKDYVVPFAGFYKALTVKDKELAQETYSKLGITLISHEVANNLNTTVDFEKLYCLNNTLYFTFDEASSTHLVVLAIKNQTCMYKKLNFKLEKLGKELKGNSFLIDNRLLRITANNKQLNLCVVDLESFALVKNYNCYPDQEIDIKNSPIVTENNGKLEPDFLDSEDFFKAMMDGDIAIAATMDDKGNYDVLIGNQQIVTIQRPNFSMGPGLVGGGGFPIMGGWGMGAYPGFYPGWGYPVNTASYTLNTYFKTSMRPDDFTHVKGPMSKNIIDKLHEFEDRAFGNNIPELYTIYKLGNKIHYGYLSKWNNTFYVVAFE